MKFELLDENGNNAFGGTISEGNVYLNGYAVYPEGKNHKDLKIGETIEVQISLSTEVGQYTVKRIE